MITRVAVTAILNRGQNTTVSFSHAGGNCDTAFVYTHRVIGTSPTAITYGGVSMTQLSTVTMRGGHQLDIWGLKDCYAGTQDVVISQSANDIRAGAVSYKGVSRTATFPNVSNTGVEPFPNDGVLPVSVTTTVDDCILIGLGGYSGSNISTVYAGADTTDVSLLDLGGEGSAIVESNPLIVGSSGAYSLEVQSGATNQDIGLLVVAIAPNTTSAGAGSPIII